MTALRHLTTVLVVLSAGPLPGARDTSPPNSQQAPADVRQIHDRVFKGTPNAIAEQLARTKGDIILDELPMIVHGTGVRDATERLAMFECRRDFPLVAIGRPEATRSYVTADGGQIYSEGRFVLEEVIRQSTGIAVRRGDSIAYLRPGGSVQIQGRRVSTADYNLRETLVDGQRYLLNFKPSSGDARLHHLSGRLERRRRRTDRTTEDGRHQRTHAVGDAGAARSGASSRWRTLRTWWLCAARPGIGQALTCPNVVSSCHGLRSHRRTTHSSGDQ